MSEYPKDPLDDLKSTGTEFLGEPIRHIYDHIESHQLKQARVYSELSYRQIADLTERWHTLNRAYCILQMCETSNTLTKRSGEYQQAMNDIRDRLLAISPPC